MGEEKTTAIEKAKPKDIEQPEAAQVPTIQHKPNEFQEQLQALIPTAGTLKLTDEQKEILFAEIDPELIEIRPDGLIYLPWEEYATRLQQAFGCEWAPIPQGQPKLEGNLVMWGFHMMIQGKYCGYSIGQQEYIPSNYSMTWGDACEGAKSNALMRLCKGLGISLELWRPSFRKKWKKKYAEEYYDKKKGKMLWRKKGDTEAEEPPAESGTGVGDFPPQEEAPEKPRVLPEKCKKCGAQMKEPQQAKTGVWYVICPNYDNEKGHSFGWLNGKAKAKPQREPGDEPDEKLPPIADSKTRTAHWYRTHMIDILKRNVDEPLVVLKELTGKGQPVQIPEAECREAYEKIREMYEKDLPE